MLRKTLSTTSTFRNFIASLHSKPDFTKNNYDVTRGNYSVVEEDHLHFFTQLLGENRVITDLSDLEKYNVDWFKHLRGCSQIVLQPKTTEEVSNILRFCNANRLAVVPQGGNTSMVGAATPIFDEIIISTELMDQIISLDETSGTLKCQAGCILQNLNDYLSEKKLIFPIDLGAKGSCHVGGNVATNAGGLRLLKYGNLHGNVLGLEVVQANGEILDCLSGMRKDNTGYHLPHIFIGSEGTLGFITKVSVQCKTKPSSVSVAFLGLQNFEKVMMVFQKGKEELDEILSAFEVIDASSMELVGEHLGLPSPIGEYPFYVLIETSGSNQEHDQDKLGKFLESALDKHVILNGTIAENPSKIDAIWKIRESIPQAFAKDGYVALYDLSVPLKDYYNMVDDMKKRMGDKAHRVFGFGHMGDSNLHLQVSIKEFSPDIIKLIEPYVYDKTMELNGSISAEHGIGFLKAKYLPKIKTPTTIRMMRNLKKIMDPNGILNPYKVIQM